MFNIVNMQGLLCNGWAKAVGYLKGPFGEKILFHQNMAFF